MNSKPQSESPVKDPRIVAVIQHGVLQELYSFATSDGAIQKFLTLCGQYVPNWDSFDIHAQSTMIKHGFAQINDHSSVCLFGPTDHQDRAPTQYEAACRPSLN